MTKGEAIKILNRYDLNFCDIDGSPIPPQDLAEAFDMAIQALEQQTAKCDNCKYSEETDGMNCYECVKGISDNFEALEQEQSEIIRCKNCRHDNNCEIQYSAQAGSKFFCGFAEKRGSDRE